MKRRFLVRLILFIVPVAGMLLTPILFAVYMGEAMPLRLVVNMQSGAEPVLYGPSDRDPIFAYRLLSIQMRQPEVLFAGSSRILQFRSGLLNKNSRAFFNSGGEGWNLSDVRELVAHLDGESAPKIMFLGIDQPWFNADFVHWEESRNLNPAEIDIPRSVAATRKVLDEVMAEEVQFETLIERDEWVRHATGLGLFALQFGRGYRNDGSFQQGELVRDPNLGELGRANDLERVPEGWRQFVKGNEVSDEMLAELDDFLQMTEDRDIFVIGFAPPFTPSIYEVMVSSGEHDYLTQSAPLIQDIFERHNYPYFDFSNAAWIGGVDEELYDGWHATELLSLRMYNAMLEALPDVLAPYSDLEHLQQIAANADNPVEVFGNQF
jgi:hypothetical protein